VVDSLKTNTQHCTEAHKKERNGAGRALNEKKGEKTPVIRTTPGAGGGTQKKKVAGYRQEKRCAVTAASAGDINLEDL